MSFELSRTLTLCASFIGCAAPHALLSPPPPAAGGEVFLQPSPVVESPDADLAPSLSNDARRVVYVASGGGSLDIFVRPMTGGASERLTANSTDDTDPVFSPDGRSIAWVSRADDVKGDVWIMGSDGKSQRRLTDRKTSDRAPAFAADGRAIYFGVLAEGAVTERIDRLELETSLSTTVVTKGWDPAPAPDGEHLFFSAPGEDGRPRLFVMRLRDRRVAPLTDGSHLEGMARATRDDEGIVVVFCRFVDDQDGNGVADADDPASLWSVRFDPRVLDGAATAPAIPLTTGENGEILPSASAGWLLFTAGRGLDLDVQALPLSGTINPAASAAAVLEAARAESSPAIKRLGLRYIVATSPELVGPARYELARELAERGKLADAIAELDRIAPSLREPALAPVAKIEIERLRLLQRLGGRLLLREVAERDFVRERAARAEEIFTATAELTPVRDRKRSFDCEVALVFGRRQEAMACLAALAFAPEVTPEDGARALDRLGEIYAELFDLDAVASNSRALFMRFPTERFYVRRAAARWIAMAQKDEAQSPFAALAAIAREGADNPSVAAEAELALADLQERDGRGAVAIDSWRHLVASYPHERAAVTEALTRLGRAAERLGDAEAALLAYERLLADFGQARATRAVAKSGLARIAIQKAEREEREGKIEEAVQSYLRLLRADRELVRAHRRFISLSARSGSLAEVLARYEREAQKKPRDKIARYGYGYALTHTRPPSLDAASRELLATLAIDARFAAAHLTLGWVHERREELRPNRGHLERALASYETAAALVSATSEPSLWAAATLNRGNALLALGKSDLAFAAYLARETSGIPHESALSELLFRESFARTALRQEEYDVAIDMAVLAERSSRTLAGEPRHSTLAALLGATYLLTSNYEDARRFYGEAVRQCRARKDWPRLAALLRGRALAEQGLGLFDDALATTYEILAALARGHAPSEPPRSLFRTEIPGNPSNVTRAVYGFSPSQEEELARAMATKVLREHGDLTRARAFDAERLRLLHKAQKDKLLGPRIALELLYANNDSASLAMRAGDPKSAAARLAEGVDIAHAKAWWSQGAELLTSLAWVWSRGEVPPDAKLLARMRDVAKEGLAIKDDEHTRRRLARFLSLSFLQEASALIEVKPGDAKDKLEDLMASLDTRAGLLAEASAHAELADDVGLLRATGHKLEELQGDATPPSWRAELDLALVLTGDERARTLRRAVDAFFAEPTPAYAPERALLLAHATELLCENGELELAWRLLERDRLLGLRPPLMRVARGELGRAWETLRDLRGEPGYGEALTKAPVLARALEGHPTTLTELGVALGDGVFVQVFAPAPGVWHWFVVQRGELLHVATPAPSQGEIPPAVLAALGDANPRARRLFLDLGELYPQPTALLTASGRPLNEAFELIDELSATYFVAATEQKSLARHDTLIMRSLTTAALAEVGRQRRLVVLDHPSHLQPSPAEQPGLAQLVFAAEGDLRIDLDTLAMTLAPAGLVLAPKVAPSRRAARALTQAMLIAGIPTVVVGEHDGDHAAFEVALTKESAASAFAAMGEGARGLWLFGDAGLDEKARVALATNTLATMASRAAKKLSLAQKSASSEAWHEARDAYTDALDTIVFLREPAHMAQIVAAPELKKKLTLSRAGKTVEPGETLLMLESGSRTGLARALVALGEVEASAKLWELAITDAEQTGDLPLAARHALALGVTLADGKKTSEAALAFGRCLKLAAMAKEKTLEADCTSRRGTEHRSLLRYLDAAKDYERAAALYKENGAPAEVNPRRYLGFLYERSFNDYEKALAHFRQALALAEKHKLEAQVPSLLLDIARVFRQRGEYERALVEVRRAQGMLKDKSPKEHAEVALEAAKIYWYRGDYRRALDEQRQGLALARRSGSTFLEIQAQSLAGLIALNQGALDDAERDILVALDLARVTGRRAEQAAQRNNLGIVQREAGRLDEAEESFRLALAIDEELGSTEGRAYDLRNLALTRARRHEYKEALEDLRTALELTRAIGDKYNETQCVFAIGEAEENMGSDAAKASYKLAAELGRAAAIPEVEWRALYGLGRIAEKKGDFGAARRLFGQALEVAERLGHGRTESYAGRGRDDLYDDAVRLAMAAADFDAAHLLIERARGRTLLDLLARGAMDELGERERELIEAEAEARDAMLTTRRTTANDKNDDAALALAEATHVQAEATLRRERPRLWRAFVIAPPTLAEFRAALPADVTVIQYHVGPRALTTLTIRKDQVRGQRHERSRAELHEATARLREALGAFANIDQKLLELGGDLLAPLDDDLLAKTRLLVVLPDGPLYHIPFSALPHGDGPLLTKTAVSHAASAAALFDELVQAPPQRPASVAAFAPAEDLPFSRLEALAIAGADALFGAEAGEDRFRAAREDAVAIAAHTELDPRNALTSALLFAKDGKSDGRLEVRELFGLRHAPTLVTLSACSSASGDTSADAFMGLGYGFAAAGTRTVVATQARVSDLAAALVMKHFYRNLRENPSAEALQRAALLVRQTLPHPAHWASFMLIGDFR